MTPTGHVRQILRRLASRPIIGAISPRRRIRGVSGRVRRWAVLASAQIGRWAQQFASGGCRVPVSTMAGRGYLPIRRLPTAHNRWRHRPPSTSMTRVSDQPSRWSKATVYPDMWVDPDEDPRNSGGVSPDGELATLQDYLSDYRLTLRMKCEGLDAEQLARRSVPPSTLSLLGLLRHLAEVERDWRSWITSGDPLPKLYGEGDADFDGAIAEQTVADAAYADLAHEQAATDAILAEHPNLGERLGKHGIAVRELLVHRIEEYARHCGHTDLLRECVDGHVGQ
jgi:uncharacterized damage-inducible protein DinB